MVSVWGLTDRGIVRRENQDSCAYEIIEDGDLAWGVVCDGMGGAKAGDVLVILEAMKMENEIMAPHDGTVAQVVTSKGATVDTGDPLVVLA